MPRFVILEHDHPHLHWDFMLEAGEVLRTWRLSCLPAPAAAIAAQPLGDHRRAYLDYEGPLSGGRGAVKRWDAGTFAWVNDAPAELIVDLHGEKCRGRLRLRRTADDEWKAAFEAASP